MTDDFAQDIDRLMDALRRALSADLVPPTAGPPIPRAPAGLPVLDHLDRLAEPPEAARDAVDRLRRLARSLRWRQTYRCTEVGDAFLRNYGWTELIGPQGLHPADDLSVGLLLLGPDTHYPLHFHAAVEHYAPLSGEAEWFDEDRGWRTVPPLQVILHRSMVRHAMQTRAQPLLALFHWSGDQIGASAQLSRAPGAE